MEASSFKKKKRKVETAGFVRLSIKEMEGVCDLKGSWSCCSDVVSQQPRQRGSEKTLEQRTSDVHTLTTLSTSIPKKPKL